MIVQFTDAVSLVEEWSGLRQHSLDRQNYCYSYLSLSQTGIINRSLQQTTLLFNGTDLSPTFINVLATVSDPISLNGTQMDCNGQTLTIDIRFISKRLYQLVCRTPY